MNLTSLRTIVRDITKTYPSTADGGSITLGDPNFPDTMVNLYLTNAAQLMGTEIVQSNDDWDFQEDQATNNLVANQREYPFNGINLLVIKRVEVCLDGTNWKRARPIADTTLFRPLSSESNIVQSFTNNEPYFKVMEKSIYIFSGTIQNVTGGIKIWYTKETVGKDTTTTPYSDITLFSKPTDIPNIAEAFQEGLCYKTAKKFFEGYSDTKRAEEMDNQFEKLITRMRQHYAQRIEPRGLRLQPFSGLDLYE